MTARERDGLRQEKFARRGAFWSRVRGAVQRRTGSRVEVGHSVLAAVGRVCVRLVRGISVNLVLSFPVSKGAGNCINCDQSVQCTIDD